MPKSKTPSYIPLIIGLLVVLVVVQTVTLIFTINPKETPVIKGLTPQEKEQVKENKELIDTVNKITPLPNADEAVIATVNDADSLRESNPINAQVYKDARDGDRVIGLKDRMIIFNEESNTIVYDGKSPAQLQQEEYLADLKKVSAAVSQLTDVDPTVTPKMATVVDPVKLQESQPEIYADAKRGDKVLVYNDKVIIYRPTTNTIIYEGDADEVKKSIKSSEDES